MHYEYSQGEIVSQVFASGQLELHSIRIWCNLLNAIIILVFIEVKINGSILCKDIFSLLLPMDSLGKTQISIIKP